MEIAVYNCLSWMHEIETGQMYMMRQDHKVYSGLGDAIAKKEQKVRRGGKQRGTEEGRCGIGDHSFSIMG